MKIAYIAHPISGAVQENLAAIMAIVRYINLHEHDIVPFAPYYVDCLSLDDSVPHERERGIRNDTEILERKFVDEVRLYGDKISNGMKNEVSLAHELGIPVIPMTDETRQAYEFLKPNEDG